MGSLLCGYCVVIVWCKQRRRVKGKRKKQTKNERLGDQVERGK